MDAAYLFARNLATVRYEDLPRDVVEATKKEILDTLGVALGGSAKSGVRELLELVTEWGGREESTVLCYGHKVPAPNAAQVNATMGHALDYDDVGEGPVHPSVVIVPACLAVAEHKGKLNGREFITAVALGVDMMCRLGLGFRLGLTAIPAGGHPGAGWHLTPLYGFMAAAGSAGKILGLDEEGMVNALGIAYHQCSGNGQCVVDGALTKRMGPGFAARGGITAALMAEKGITGARNCLEGECGLYNLYHHGSYDSRAMTADLGKHFEGTNVGMKPYPCCKGTHSFVDVALALVNKHDIKAEDVQEITIFGHGQANLCLPLEVKSRPRNLVDSQFSIPWAVAVAVARRRAAIGDFTEEAIKSPDILEVASRIKVVMDPGQVPSGSEIPPARVKVTMKKGQTYSGQAAHPSGSSQGALPFSDYERKFRDCASYSVKQLSDGHIDRVIALTGQLERLDDIREIIELLS